MIALSKRLVAGLASTAALAMALSGCGSDSGSSNTTADPNEKVTITYLHRLQDKEDAGMVPVSQIVERWNKDHPNIQVKATQYQGKAQDMTKKIETDVKNGADSVPDLAQVGYAELPDLVSKELLQPVTAEANKYKDNFASGPFALTQVAGESYGLPQDTGPLVYFYNETEFKNLGIEVPKSADELVESAKKTAAQGKYIVSFQADEAGNLLTGLAGASGAWFKDEGDGYAVDTNTAGSKAVADVFQQLLDAKAAATDARWDPAFSASLQSGKLIGTIGAAWEAPLILGDAGDAAKGQWRVAQVGDWFGNGDKTGPDGGSLVSVLKTSKHPAQAMEFLNWFNTQVDDLTSQGLVVAAKKEAKAPEAWTEFFGGQDVLKEFATANNNTGDFTFVPGWAAVAASMTETAGQALNGGKVSDIFTGAQKAAEESIKGLGYDVK